MVKELNTFLLTSETPRCLLSSFFFNIIMENTESPTQHNEARKGIKRQRDGTEEINVTLFADNQIR